MPPSYVTHARTPDELRAEFLSDLARRAASIDLQIKHSTSQRRTASLALVRQELDQISEYWTQIKLPEPQSRTRKKSLEGTEDV